MVTVVWSDGVNRTPPVLFTFNGKFRLDRVGRKGWVPERDNLVNALARFGIDAKRILYIGAEQNETRRYVSESAELLRRFAVSLRSTRSRPRWWFSAITGSLSFRAA